MLGDIYEINDVNPHNSGVSQLLIEKLSFVIGREQSVLP